MLLNIVQRTKEPKSECINTCSPVKVQCVFKCAGLARVAKGELSNDQNLRNAAFIEHKCSVYSTGRVGAVHLEKEETIHQNENEARIVSE